MNIIIAFVTSVYRLIYLKYFLTYRGCFELSCEIELRFSFLIELTLYIVDLSYMFKYGGHIYLNYFAVYDQIDEILGTTYNSIIKAKLIRITVCLTTISVMYLSVVSIYWLFFVAIKDIMFKVAFGIGFVINAKHSLTLIELCANIMQIEYRLKSIKEKLQDFYCFAGDRLDTLNAVRVIHWMYFSKNKGGSKNMVGPSKMFVSKQFCDIIGLKKCYLLLLEQKIYINQVFGVRNLQVEFAAVIVISVLFTFDLATHLFSVVYRCEKVYEQRNEIINILDHLLVEKKISKYFNIVRNCIV
ncbi:hypothetical protein ABMA27_005790 [Loxostege sticticalis]|uniref:Gustatory receptor n=1 Tax=Loxostege sticticalis TaxID=481309 RepID=A0ABR3HGI0_LOXSC